MWTQGSTLSEAGLFSLLVMEFNGLFCSRTSPSIGTGDNNYQYIGKKQQFSAGVL